MKVPLLGLPTSSDSISSATDQGGSMEEALPWLLILPGALLLAACIWLLGSPVGDLLFGGQRPHPLPIYSPQFRPKPAELGRFVLAIVVVFAVAGAILATPRAFELGSRRRLRRMVPFGVAICQLVAVGVCVWAWRGQNEGINQLTVVQFHVGNLGVAILIAAALAFAARRGWLAWIGPEAGRRRGWAWASVAAVVTALWLAPALYHALNLAHSMDAVWYPLQLTYDEFMSVLDGRTPLVNFNAEYTSLLPFVAEPVFKLFGASVGTFTGLMCALSLLAFMCVERSLAMVARNERIALALYIPLLAISLFTLRHLGDERYYMADYYEVLPIRYVGPCVLLWLSTRQLRGLRPRRSLLVFAFAGLVAINNTEFGVPALGGCVLALASAQIVPRTGSLGRFRHLCGELLLGLVLAVVAVVVFVLLRSGSLPELSRITEYDRIFAVGGYSFLPTPNAGLHIIIFMTFAATLIVAALRMRSIHPDRVMTGALVFSGTFGLGVGSYYMGRSFPEVLSALFLAWGFASALLCLLALRTLTDRVSHPRIRLARALPIATALVVLGLLATSIDQFPAPWTQWRRITRNTHTLLFNTAPAARFVRGASRPGEHVAVVASLGHVIGREAGVIDVTPYNHPLLIATYEEVDEVLASLRAGHGDTVFTGGVVPEIGQVLTAKGFRVVAQDPSSSLSEWRKPGEARSPGT